MTDTEGNILAVKVHAANIHDTKSGCKVIVEALKRYATLKCFSVDKGYRGTTFEYVKNELKKDIEIPKKKESSWKVQPKRWIVERTFAWLGCCRRLSKDFEKLVKSAENMIRVAMIYILLRRTQ